MKKGDRVIVKNDAEVPKEFVGIEGEITHVDDESLATIYTVSFGKSVKCLFFESEIELKEVKSKL